MAVSGIARPGRFHAALRAEGWKVAREVTFRDHHWFTTRDLSRIAGAAREVDADLIVTTEKDAVRVEGVLRPAAGIPWAYLPMEVTIGPHAEFLAWLRDEL